MRSTEYMNTDINHELETKPRVEYLGKLADLGIGNPNGIPSYLADKSDAERIEYGEKALEALRQVTDFTHLACIDGRNCICNADKSAPEIRRRHVSGTNSTLEIALNANAPVLDTVNLDGSLEEITGVLEDNLAEKTGILPSAHEGGCGGVNGAISHNKAIAEKPEIMSVTETIMNLPAVQTLTDNLQYDSKIGTAVRDEARKTATFLEAKGWNGQERVDTTAAKEPAGVEELEHDDSPFHGHKEAGVFIIVSLTGKTIAEGVLKELGLGEAFAWNVDASYDTSKAQTGNGGEPGLKRNFISDIAKHVATTDDLVSDQTPVYLIAC